MINKLTVMKKKRIPLTFSLQEGGKRVLLAENSANCDCRSGKLKSGMGASVFVDSNGSTHTCPVDNVVKLAIKKDYHEGDKRYIERFAALAADGKFYLQDASAGEYFVVSTGAQDAGIVQFAGSDSRYKLALIKKNSCVYFKDDDTFDIAPLEGTCRFGCFYNHRFFVGMLPSALACSAPENELDFTESIHDGGLIRFPNAGGTMVAMKPYSGYLYLFFERGITRVNVSGAVKNFTADTLSYTGGTILGKTVCAGSSGIYFMAEDGAYRFDGKKATRLLPDFVLVPSEKTGNERAVAFAGRIFLRYRTKQGDRTLVVYEDGESGYYLDQMPVFYGEDGGRCLFMDENNVVYCLSETGERGVDGIFADAWTDLGLSGRKTLTDLCFTGKGSFTLTVKTSGRSFTRTVTFQKGVANVKLSERGELFSFTISLPYGAEIDSMTATVAILQGGERE